ncbi:hypothetical protein [Rhizobium paranaense]|uniref:Membrane bound FAD containing D-sorbitol dehydrogenase n=1 Tax=Rhizobium paranaense TaxID=1650438 RepID=A0A7W9D2E3_9HYPH|nr:hypothetical protein [Rhizobium paranaense]MBB5574791.1 hypothetical protein [Rhizobium paranaense]
MTIEDPHRFLAFSTEVTAFGTFELWATGQVEAYLATVNGAIGDAILNELLSDYEKICLQTEGQAASERKARLRREIFGSEKLGPVARNIIKLWYVGTWYGLPGAWCEAFGARPKDVTFVVSPAAYTEGLMWKAIGAHPAGAKAPGYGSWASPPRIPAFAGEAAIAQVKEVQVNHNEGLAR